MIDLKELRELGLSDGQVRVYQALIESGSSGIQKIQEKTGLERRAIYDILNKLIEYGFVTYILQNKIKSYQCTDPSSIEAEIKDKQEKLRLLQDKIPKMSEMFHFSKPDVGAEIIRGNEGMKALLNEALEYDATYWIGGNNGVEECSEEMSLWFKSWTKRRIEKKRFMYDLVDFQTHLEDFPAGDIARHKKGLYKYCELPPKLSSPIVTIIFGDKVVQVNWSKRSFAVVMDSKEIKDSYMKYFNYFWKDPW